MAELSLKIPRKLHRVEIIRAKDFDRFSIPIESESITEDEVFEQDDISKDSKELKFIKTQFYQEFSFPESDRPHPNSQPVIPLETLPVIEVNKAIQEAYNNGFVDGEQLVRNSYDTEIQKHQEWIRNIDEVVENLKSEYYQQLIKIEDSVVSLAIMVAEHILNKEISIDSIVVVEQTKKAIESLDNDTIFKIHLNPRDIKILEESKSLLTKDTSKIDKVVLNPNESVEPGGCMLETSAGMIDARIKTQLEKIENSLISVPRTSEEEIFQINEYNQ